MAIFGNKKKSVIERLDELLEEIEGLCKIQILSTF